MAGRDCGVTGARAKFGMAADPERAYTSGSMGQAGSRFGRRSLLQGSLGLTGLALLAGCGMLAPQAQQPRKLPRLGFLAPTAPFATPSQQAFIQALQDLGYLDGQTIAIEYRWGDGREERLPDLAAELVAANVDVIYAWNTLAARAANGATSTIPIVFGAANDPVEAGLVASLAHPGGNVTGPSTINSGLNAKRLELLKGTVPGLSRVAVLAYAAGATTERDWAEVQEAAPRLGVVLRRHEVSSPESFDDALGTMAAEAAEALITLGDSFLARNAGRITDLAARYRLPAVYEQRMYTDVGGLMSYGPSIIGAHRRAAAYVDRILKGAKPADLPVEQAMTFEFVINLKAAQALGLTIPQEVLIQATEVIQ
jgi:putative ABC transport system substrate-binding protein